MFGAFIQGGTYVNFLYECSIIFFVGEDRQNEAGLPKRSNNMSLIVHIFFN